MSLAVGHSDQYCDLKRYMLIGVSRPGHPFFSFWTMFDSSDEAKFTAMAWLVAGFTTRVVDLRLGVTDETPVITCSYGALQDVTSQVPQVVSYSLQIVPPDIPWPITQADFFSWLTAFSQQPPTWDGQPVSTTQVQAQSRMPMGSSSVPWHRSLCPPNPPSLQATKIEKPPTTGVQHIEGNGSSIALCGCEGHVEPNWEHTRPLKRDVKYCEECLRMRIQCHQDYMRGWGRMRQSSIHGNASTYVASNKQMPILWEEEESLPQAEPLV